MTWQVVEGDCLDVMAKIPDASVDAIVTDPPYGLGFMGREWDREAPGIQIAELMLRVLKPGGHLLAFGGTRTYHRLACAIEDAGFEIRDCLSWMYGSGFPKSHNLDGDREGWGTALKPAHEPIVLARKPLAGTVAANVERFGTGALNVNGCRVPAIGESPSRDRRDFAARIGRMSGVEGQDRSAAASNAAGKFGFRRSLESYTAPRKGEEIGRWPPNVLLGHGEDCYPWACQPGCPVRELDRQGGLLTSGTRKAMKANGLGGRGRYNSMPDADLPAIEGDAGGASRFFPQFHMRFRYVPKASSSEREAGDGDSTNMHPTVKPIALMRWLCRLVTPLGGLVLDPFAGSGTTGIAATREGFRFLGIEREHVYVEIARARIVGDSPLFNTETDVLGEIQLLTGSDTPE